MPPASRGSRRDFAALEARRYEAAKLLRKGTLKVYEKFPHGMCTTHADVVNADLLTFIKS